MSVPIFTTLLLLSTATFAQLPPAVEVLPAGFKLTEEVNLGASIIIRGTKANENFPKPHMDQGIQIEITWMRNPAADQILEMVVKQPEDPAGRNPGSATREEPCGVERYRGGVLRCRKVITPWIGGGSGPDLVTWRLGWTGKGPDGLVGVGVNNFVGSKETALAWIDAIIPKITKTR
jgi:hypothetical protein